MVICYVEHVHLMPYVYSFCQIFQALRLFPALRLFRRLEYCPNVNTYVLCLKACRRPQSRLADSEVLIY